MPTPIMKNWAVRLQRADGSDAETYNVDATTKPKAIAAAKLLAPDYTDWTVVFANIITDGRANNGISAGIEEMMKLLADTSQRFEGAPTRSQAIAWFENPPEDFNQKCQAMLYQFCLHFGSAPVIYPTAEAAHHATPIVSTDMDSAPLGAVGYASLGTAGHVMISLGGGLWAMGSAHANTWFNAAKHVGYSTWAQYHAATGAGAEGWGHSDGANTFTIVADPVVVTATQRQAVAAGANARSAPNTTVPVDTAHSLLGGAVGNFDGWIHGEAVSGNDVWFHGAISGDWFWSGGFVGGANTASLTDMNPVVTPPVSTVRTVGSSAANKRSDPSTAHAATGSAAAGTAITMTGFASNGQSVSGNALWYFDGTSWYWSGGFTTQDSSGLTDLSSTIVPPVAIVPGAVGIDVSGVQAGIDFAQVKSAGAGFAIVKLGGLNVAPEYVTTSYATLVDAAKAAGLKVGHYWLIGTGDPVAEAQYFVSNLHSFDVENDVLALDNEDLDSNGTRWTDAQASAFFNEVITLTGIPASRLWHYANATDYKNGAPWTATEALGVKVWWAAYSAAPTTMVPDFEPVVTGVVSDWWVHQYTDKLAIAGMSVDGSWSRQTVDVLFATGTVTPVTPPVVTPPVVVPPAPTTVTVSFDSLGGTAVDSETIDSGSVATKPADPVLAGSTFEGWFTGPEAEATNGTAFDFSTVITADTELYAKWSATPVVTPPVVTPPVGKGVWATLGAIGLLIIGAIVTYFTTH